MKIIVFCQYYYPENFQINDICECLVRDGNYVTVITGLPNYPSGIVSDEYKRGHKRVEIINGVNVIRCFEIGRGKRAMSLALNYLSYCASGTIMAGKIAGDYDIVFSYQLSPVLMAIPAIRYARKNKKPLLLYCCDIWPESIKLIVKKESSLLFKITKKISTQIYSSCDKILTQSSSFIPYIKRVHFISSDKLSYLPAFASDDYLEEDFTARDKTIDFVFLGNIGIAQDLEGVIDAIATLNDLQGFILHIVGNGSNLNNIKIKVENMGLCDKVIFYGRRPVTEMPGFYKLADACVVSLKSDNLTGLTLPSKVQGYMAAGKTIIGMIDGPAKEVIQESGCGICVSAGDVLGMASAMREFILHKSKYQNCGANGRRYFKEHFSKTVFMRAFYKEINELRGTY